MTKDFVNVGKENYESNVNLISIPPHCYLTRQFRTPPSTPISPVGWKIYAQNKRGKETPRVFKYLRHAYCSKSFCDRKLGWAFESLPKPLVTWSPQPSGFQAHEYQHDAGFETTKLKYSNWPFCVWLLLTQPLASFQSSAAPKSSRTFIAPSRCKRAPSRSSGLISSISCTPWRKQAPGTPADPNHELWFAVDLSW